MRYFTPMSRRSSLKLTLGLMGSVGLIGCSQQASAPGKFTVQTVAAPAGLRKSSSGYTAPKNKFNVETLSVDDRQRQYHAYKPGQSKAPPRAILLLLHGSNRTGASLVDKWKRLADEHNILLVAPDSFSPRVWSAQDDSPAFLTRVLDHAKDTYAAGDVSVYGFGHSAGAIMMTYLSMWHADMFKAIAVHAGYIPVADAKRSRKIKTPKAPLAHFLGTEDHIFSVEKATNCARTLADYGQTVELTLISGHNHWYYDIAPFVNSKAWSFLSSYP